jgi:hypothetical protein
MAVPRHKATASRNSQRAQPGARHVGQGAVVRANLE